MWPQIVLMIGFLIAALFVLYLFIADIVAVAVNGVLLYLIGLRIYVEITKHRKTQEYILGFAAALIIITLVGNYFPLWKITTFVLLTFLLAQLMKIIRK